MVGLQSEPLRHVTLVSPGPWRVHVCPCKERRGEAWVDPAVLLVAQHCVAGQAFLACFYHEYVQLEKTP